MRERLASYLPPVRKERSARERVQRRPVGDATVDAVDSPRHVRTAASVDAADSPENAVFIQTGAMVFKNTPGNLS